MIGSARSIKHVLAIFLDCRFNVMSLSRTGQGVSHSSRPVKIKKNGVNARFLTVNVRSSITGWPRGLMPLWVLPKDSAESNYRRMPNA